MNIINTDIAIIGAGTAGLTAYKEASKYTDKILLIEGNQYGTTCARVGCMPSKLLIAAGEIMENINQAHEFGINIDKKDISINGKAVMQRVQRERDKFVNGVLEDVDRIPDNNKIMAHAKFINNHELELSNGQKIKAKAIIIATGSRPKIPPNFDAFKNKLITSDDVFELPNLPKSVLILGAGVIGLELGQALHNLGVETHLFGVRGGFASLSDRDIRDEAIRIFSNKFDIDVDASQEKINSMASKVEYIISAIGRTPNLDNLGLENTEIDYKNLDINPETLQACPKTSNIFVIGDSNNLAPLLHEAAFEGRAAGRNAVLYCENKEPEQFKRSVFMGVVFSSPNIAIVGSKCSEIDNYEYGEVNFADQGRAKIILKNEGLLRVYGECGTGKVLGAEMVCPAAEHLAHLLAWSIQENLTIFDLLKMPFYHPVIEEGLRTALRDLKLKL